MEKEQVQKTIATADKSEEKNLVALTEDGVMYKNDTLKYLKIGEYHVLPLYFVTRETYMSNNGNELWSYKMVVDFYGVTKAVNFVTAKEFRAGRDKYGYSLLDAIFEAIGFGRLAVKVEKDIDGNAKSVEYWVGGVKEVKGKNIFNGIQVVTAKGSSESLIVSTVNDLNIEYDMGLPVL